MKLEKEKEKRKTWKRGGGGSGRKTVELDVITISLLFLLFPPLFTCKKIFITSLCGYKLEYNFASWR